MNLKTTKLVYYTHSLYWTHQFADNKTVPLKVEWGVWGEISYFVSKSFTGI